MARPAADTRAAGLFLHGTIAINTILERTGARTALLITEGFRDIYEIGRINRPDAYNLFFRKHQPLVERALRFEVSERVLADGEVDTPLDEDEVERLGRALHGLGCGGNRHPVSQLLCPARHEARAKAILERNHPAMFVSASHEPVRGISRVRALLDGGRQCLCRADRAPLYRVEMRTAFGGGFGGSFLVMQSTGGLYEAGPGKNHCVHASRDRRRVSSAPRPCAARSASEEC